MKRFLVSAIGLAFMIPGLTFAGEASAVAIATHGGRATANSTAIGNARSIAIAGATNGGRAVSNSVAQGWRNGFADSRSVATADHGVALSNSNADATGVFGGTAIADSESIAATIGGLAVSNSDARADGAFHGHARSRSAATALSEYGSAFSDSRSTSRGRFGGVATSESDAFSDAFLGRADSRSEAVSDATLFGRAHANGRDVSVTRGAVGFEPQVHVKSRAVRLRELDGRSAWIGIRR